MDTLVIVAVAAALLVAFIVVTRVGARASVPGRLARAASADGTRHGTPDTDRAPTGRPGDASAEDQLAFRGDAAPGQPAPRPGLDPDAPGRSVDDVTSPSAVEPDEPA